MQLLERGEPVPKTLNLRGKRNAAYAAQLSIQAAQKLFNAAGGRALYSDNVMQRMLRDCLAAAAHHSLGWDCGCGQLWAACAEGGDRKTNK